MKPPNKGSPPSPLADKRDHAIGRSTCTLYAGISFHFHKYIYLHIYICRNQKQWIKKGLFGGTSLAVQWLRHCSSTVGGMGAIPGRGTKILPAVWCSQNTAKKNTQKRKLEFCYVLGTGAPSGSVWRVRAAVAVRTDKGHGRRKGKGLDVTG